MCVQHSLRVRVRAAVVEGSGGRQWWKGWNGLIMEERGAKTPRKGMIFQVKCVEAKNDIDSSLLVSMSQRNNKQ